MEYHLEMRISDLKNTHQGGRCVLVGNGPSLNRQDLRLLDGETIWCFNRGYLLFERVTWRPNFFLAMDSTVLRNSIYDLRHWVRQLSATRFILPAWLLENKMLEEAANILWFDLRCGSYSSSNWDMTVGLCLAHTVTAVAISLAVDMGFSQVVLIGCDMSYSVAVDGKSFNACSTKDQDHFDDRYLNASGVWTTPDVPGMLEDYKQALRHANSKGVNVINVTDGGMLNVFERKCFRSVFACRD